MAINFIPNDPLAGPDAPPMRTIEPSPDRPSHMAHFLYVGNPPEDVYDLNINPEGFVFWQCREAALRTLSVWEKLDGALPNWARSSLDNAHRQLELIPNHGVDLDAYYDGDSLAFFVFPTNLADSNRGPTYSGLSTDIVAHEIGHALLDVLRDDFWDNPFIETASVHESFADIIALLVALSDQPTREALLKANPELLGPNFVESIAEDLSDSIRIISGPQAPGSQPRHASNTFAWQSTALLSEEPQPPMTLSRDSHSFGRVFTGCFYDLLRLMFLGGDSQTESALWEVAQSAGRLLIAAVKIAPLKPRLFRSVGQAMVFEDRRLFNGRNSQWIRQAFAKHNIGLGNTDLNASSAFLKGALFHSHGVASLSNETKAELFEDLKLTEFQQENAIENPLHVADTWVTQVVYPEKIPLAGLNDALQDVFAIVQQEVRIGEKEKKPVLLGDIPYEEETIQETRQFVASLIASGRLYLDQVPITGDAHKAYSIYTRDTWTKEDETLLDVEEKHRFQATHYIVEENGVKVLKRSRFI